MFSITAESAADVLYLAEIVMVVVFWEIFKIVKTL